MKTLRPSFRNLIVTFLLLLLPVVGASFYILGSINGQRRSSIVWMTHFIPTELAAAKAVRDDNATKALKILENNALFYERSLKSVNLPFLPTRWDLDYFFHPEPYDLGTLDTKVNNTRKVAVSYIAAYPESTQRLPK